GVYWVATAIGLSRRLAATCAVIGITTPYYVTDLYGRGAWTELVAVSMVALLVGSVARYLTTSSPERSDRVSLVLVTVSSALLVGTHNITTAVGVPFVLVSLLLLVRLFDVRRAWRRVVTVLMAAAVGVMLTAAWTVPNLWLARQTAISKWVLASK